MMRYLSVCSGIETVSVAWKNLGFEPAAFAEIEPFPASVLAHHYPEVPNVGDFTSIKGDEFGTIDVLVGGTPCQSFSVAGKRGGLEDARGNLALEYGRLAHRSGAKWVLWENVPGVLSSAKGEDFGQFLYILSGVDLPVPPKGWKNSGVVVGLDGHFSLAWRVLDAQYFGVPQRRRRVFVVGHLGDWRRAASVLLESESLCGNPPTRRKAGEEITNSFTPSSHGGYAEGIGSLRANGGDLGGGSESLVIGNEGYIPEIVPQAMSSKWAKGTSGPAGDAVANLIAVRTANTGANGHGLAENVAHTLDGANGQAVAFVQNSRDEVRLLAGDGQIVGVLAAEPGAKQQCYVAAFQSSQSGVRESDTHATLDSNNGSRRHNGVIVPDVKQVQWASGGGQLKNDTTQALRSGAETNYQFLRVGMAVRRLTPLECERLQGFPDNYTLVNNAADTPRYKAIGNAMAVPVIRWIGERILKYGDKNANRTEEDTSGPALSSTLHRGMCAVAA